MLIQMLFGFIGGICGTIITLWCMQVIDEWRLRLTSRRLHD